jgi:hypothetical protein
VLSLTLTYLMQVYSALQRRNALGLKLELMSGETGDAAELIARLGPEGAFTAGYTDLSEIATQMIDIKEVHHFYPVLFYFLFPRPFYSVSRFTLVALDTHALIQTALDDKHRWLRESASVTAMARAAQVLVITLERTFLPGGRADPNRTLPPKTSDLWRKRYDAAVQRLKQAGIETSPKTATDVERYIQLRSAWDRDVAKLSPRTAFTLDEIDPACGNACTR